MKRKSKTKKKNRRKKTKAKKTKTKMKKTKIKKTDMKKKTKKRRKKTKDKGEKNEEHEKENKDEDEEEGEEEEEKRKRRRHILRILVKCGDEMCRNCGKEPKCSQCVRSHEAWRADCPERKKETQSWGSSSERLKKKLRANQVGSVTNAVFVRTRLSSEPFWPRWLTVLLRQKGNLTEQK